MGTVVLPKSMEDVKASGEFKCAEAGVYTVAVKAVEERKGKDSGKPYLNVRLQIIDDDEFTGACVFTMLSLSADALGFLKGFLLAMDEDGDISEFDPDEWIGNELDVELTKVIKYNTDPSDEIYENKVKRYIYED